MAEDIKERLIAAAERLIREGMKSEDIKVRDIARAAGVSPGLVNYHFGSKSELLSTASERIWADFAPRWQGTAKPGAEGIEALGILLKDIGEAVNRTAAGSEAQVRQELLAGDLSTTRFLLPILKSILPPDCPEFERKLAAYFLVVPLQMAFLRREFLSEWLDLDMERKEERDRLFDFAIDRILGPYRGKPDRKDAPRE